MAISSLIQRRTDWPPVIPDIYDWPIYKITRDRNSFTEDWINSVREVILQQNSKPGALQAELAKTMYLEKIRLTQNPWKTDTKEDKAFWDSIRKRVLANADKPAIHQIDPQELDILNDIITYYADEIRGNFKPQAYGVASQVLPLLFHRLLNTASSRNLQRIWNNQFKMDERIRVVGAIEQIRNLATKGTVILLPTHYSNLDSILIGYIIHDLGLPAFLYGAGLNLFTNPVLSYFMGNLGAYKIDRRKKGSIYIETLKSYSRQALLNGGHSLFFPGGTRSRSGELEKQLKLGLIGTAIDAQRIAFMKDDPASPANKVFVVPLVFGYHFVLEASSLIADYLKTTGKEKYFINPQVFPGFNTTAKFLWKFFSAKSEVYISFGKAFDLFGNEVNEQGYSIDKHGRSIDLKQYFMSNGVLSHDVQRDAEYTRMLGEFVTERYLIENVILSSYIVSFVSFQMLKARYPHLDLYGLLRLPEEDRVLNYDKFAVKCTELRDEVLCMVEEGKAKAASHLYGDIHRLIKHGLSNIGIYHTQKAVAQNKDGDITSQDMNLLYYYQNRLVGYGLERFFV